MVGGEIFVGNECRRLTADKTLLLCQSMRCALPIRFAICGKFQGAHDVCNEKLNFNWISVYCWLVVTAGAMQLNSIANLKIFTNLIVSSAPNGCGVELILILIGFAMRNAIRKKLIGNYCELQQRHETNFYVFILILVSGLIELWCNQNGTNVWSHLRFVLRKTFLSFYITNFL